MVALSFDGGFSIWVWPFGEAFLVGVLVAVSINAPDLCDPSVSLFTEMAAELVSAVAVAVLCRI
jgi:hypothetical protein